MVGEAKVVVRGEADETLLVDRDDRPLGGRHHPERPIQVAFLERRDLVVGVRQLVLAWRRRHLVMRPGMEGRASSSCQLVQSITTLPEEPVRAGVNGASSSREAHTWGVVRR